MDNIQTRAAKVRSLADQIENNPNDRKAVAEALRVIAGAMEPCEDCGHQQEPQQESEITFCTQCSTHSDSMHRATYCTCGDPINGPKSKPQAEANTQPDATDAAAAGV